MDFNFDTSPTNEEPNNNQSQPQEDQKQTNLDDMLNMEFKPFTDDNQNNLQPPQSQDNMDFMMNNIGSSLPPKVDEEEQKRLSDRQKEADERRQKINEKMKKEEEQRNEIRKKASQYLLEFEEKRQEDIANRRKALEEKNSEINNNIGGGKNNAESWQNVNSNIDLKDSEYKGSKDVQRMREAMMNRKNDPNSEPLQNFFC